MTTGFYHGNSFLGIRNSGSGVMVTGIPASGQRVAFGTFVTESGTDGYIKMLPSTATIAGGYIGVAADNVQKMKGHYDGFYEYGDKVPIITNGTANCWLLGGQTVVPGQYLKAGAALGSSSGADQGIGILVPESSGTRTAISCAKYVGTAAAGLSAEGTVTDYSQAVTVSGNTVTMNAVGESAAINLSEMDLKEGDFIVLASSEFAEVNMVLNPEVTTSTFTTTITPLVHVTTPFVYKLIPINCLIL